MEKVTKSKDGIPQWNGDARSFQEYEEMSLLWDQSIPYHKRYLSGPKLISELSGSARKLIVGKRPDWLSHAQGVEYLMQHLRKSLGRPQIPELTEHLNRYFRGSSRKKGETMNDYITRKSEVYARAKQALMRVQQYKKTRNGPTTASSTSSQSNWSTWQHSQWQSWQDNDQYDRWHDCHETTSTSHQGAGQEGPDEDHDDQQTSQAMTPADPWAAWQRYGPRDEHEAWVHEEELLPEFLQAWYLLADAGLNAQERNMIQTAIGETYTIQRMSQELRTQWPEEDLLRRDQLPQARASGFWHEKKEDSEDEETDGEMTSAAALIANGMNDEGIALMTAAVEAEEEAMTALHQAKRTLREARAKQHQVKLSRQYYKTTEKTYKDGKPTGGAGTSGVKCFRCGGPHKVAQCPDRQAPRREQAHQAQEEAPFVCFSDHHMKENEDGYFTADEGVDDWDYEVKNHEGDLQEIEKSTTTGDDTEIHQQSSWYTEEAYATEDAGRNRQKTTEEAIQMGYGIIDGGATRTLASVHALEAMVNENLRKHQDGRVLEVDTDNQPLFGFGNSSREKCLSTAKMKIVANQKDGVLTVHTLDKGVGPMLLSIATLRALKAVIDFEEDLICFRAIDPDRVIQLERSQAGHQLLSMTDDLYKEAVPCTKPVPSLRAFCR